jgi:hypothetical protein
LLCSRLKQRCFAIIATVEAIASVDEFHLIVVCGRNENLRDTLQNKRLGTIIGWTVKTIDGAGSVAGMGTVADPDRRGAFARSGG